MPLTATTTAGPAICKITATGAAADSDISRYCQEVLIEIQIKMALLTKRASTWLLDHKAEVLQDCFHEQLSLLYKLHFLLVHESHANSTNAPIPDRPRNGSV